MVAGGLDNQLKFLEFRGENREQLAVSYKIKVPSEIFALDFSHDGNHFAMGLNDGSLVIKSKALETEADKMDEE